MNKLWSITPQKVQLAIQKIIEFSKPRKLILFGSYVRGNMHLNSDLDILVVTKNHIENPRKESIRIRRYLKGILVPMDIIVISENQLKQYADIPGLIYREALKHGKIVYESS